MPIGRMRCVPGCFKCCLETEMILSEDDIRRIESLGYRREEFCEYRDGFYRLKNVDGHCVFLDVESGRCKIYRHRPTGCRTYPVIYDPDRGFLIDPECPAGLTMSKREFAAKKRVLKSLLRALGIEVRE